MVFKALNVPGGRLPACHYDQPMTTSIIYLHYVRGSKNSDKSARLIFHCCDWPRVWNNLPHDRCGSELTL